MVCTIRKNKPEPPTLLLATRGKKVFTLKFAFTSAITIGSYLPKRNKKVVLLSTMPKTDKISDHEDRKLNIILYYNHNTGGMGNLDKVVNMQLQEDDCPWSCNAFVLWNKINPTWMSEKNNKRMVFLEQLGKALASPHID